MSLIRFDRVASRPLSLWQTAVATHARQQPEVVHGKVSQTMVMQHPMVRAAAAHVTATYEGNAPTAELVQYYYRCLLLFTFSTRSGR